MNEAMIDPMDELAECADAIRESGVWDRLGVPERWPLATDQVVRLLAACGYAITKPMLLDLVVRGILRNSGVEPTHFEWDATDVVRAVSILEFRRCWQPCHQFHFDKFTTVEHSMNQARAAGPDVVADTVLHPANGIPRFDITHLLEMLVRCPDENERRGLATLAKLTLQHDHGVFIQ